MSHMRQPNVIGRWEPTELASTILSASSRQVVRAWISRREFLDEHHDPVMLIMDTHSKDSFTRLVQSANPDLAPAVVLNELLRKGVVEPLDSGYLMLRRSVYAPSQPRLQNLQNESRINRVFETDDDVPRRRYNDVY
ncbi:hypothetical protein CLH62_06510 [Marinobacter guineae]|uniref:Uncharacterized protein n=1 Tax=Marinobacter guineae TaxID=432303 RepID=A0A2G1VL51_9GAMM|nr:hypothetical protein [Marinobacter guineae]PHQ27219.1 hypothetical protein CLH62_06510 [Marinobacter guineae]